jgi:hypothetical protein
MTKYLNVMKDAYSIIGKEVYYKEKTWTVKDFFYVPNNTNIYVGLRSGGITLNVILDDVMSLLIQ